MWEGQSQHSDSTPHNPSTPAGSKYCALQLIGWNRLPMCTIPGRKLIKPLDTLPASQAAFVCLAVRLGAVPTVLVLR